MRIKNQSYRCGMSAQRVSIVAASLGLVAAILGGCPSGLPTSEFVAGSTGQNTQLGDRASVVVLSPVSNLSITGGTPVQATWTAIATTNFSTIDVIFDVDQDPTNGNEIFAQTDLALGTSTALLDTTTLSAGSYFVGVLLNERNVLSTFDYAPGQITINQRAQFFFNSPRDNFTFDRTVAITPRFDVSWTVFDPDSIFTVQIFLDPDSSPNGNEFLLRTSTSQSGDSFTFDLPTASFAAGTYRILAIVSDGVSQANFYAPGTIVLRARLAGLVDLRPLSEPNSPIQGAIFEGFNPRDNNGSFVMSVRDIDSDGFGDFIMVSQFAKPFDSANIDRTGEGEAQIIYGRAQRFSGLNNVNSAGALFRAEIYTGPQQAVDPVRPSRGITSVALLSDWDNDGVRELAFGIPYCDSVGNNIGFGELDPPGYFRSGCVVVQSGSVFRPDLGFPGSNTRYVTALDELGAIAHSVIQPNPQCPESFYGPKAPASTQSGSLTSYYRHLDDIQGTPNRGSIVLGARYSSNDDGDDFGETISAYEPDAIIMSAPNRDPSTCNFSVSSPIPGAGVISTYYCFSAEGNWPWENTQAPPANADFNYLGMPAPADINLFPHGGPYFYIVDDIRSQLTPAGFTLPASPGFWVDRDDSPSPGCQNEVTANAPDVSSTFRIFGTSPGARTSGAVAIGDVNMDGIRDILVGDPLINNGAGACYIVLGRFRNLIQSGELAISELALPVNSTDSQSRIINGIQIRGAPGTRLGESQDDGGDFNGDGIPDVIIGSPLLNNRQGGAAVFFGGREATNLTQDEIPYDEIASRGLGVNFVGEFEGDLAGARVAGVGDVDGDGLADIMIAAPEKSIRADIDQDGVLDIDRTNCGVVYLIYGSSTLSGTINLAQIGTETLPGVMFVGRNSGDFLGAGLGEQGDRSHGIASAGDVDGDGRVDLLISSINAAPRSLTAAGEVYLIYGLGD